MILLYHKIFPEAKTIWWVTPNKFYLQMHDLQNKKVVYLDDYDISDPDHFVITFDGVYDNLWKYAVPILQHFGYPFELFIVGGSIGRGNEFDTEEPYASFADKTTLSKMVSAGGRLQWHTWSHPVLVGENDPDVIKNELLVPDDIRRVDPQGFNWFAFPHGRRDENLINASRKYFKGALACDDGSPENIFDLQRNIVYEETRFTKTKVSLIIPCYNYGHFAAEAIESALKQTYPPDEILFIDDASSDSSVETARRYEPDIRVEVNERNLGVIENFKKAVGLTSGDYICFLGADNRFRSDYVDKCKALLDRFPDTAVAYTHFALFGQRAALEAERTNAHQHPMVPSIFLRDFPEHPQEDIYRENYMHGSSMYRRDAYQQAGGYSADDLAEDHSLFIRMIDAGWKSKLVNDYLLEYRQHSPDQLNMLKMFEMENVYLRQSLRTYQEHLNIYKGKVNELQENQKKLASGILLENTSLAYLFFTKYRSLIEFLIPEKSKRRHLYSHFILFISKSIGFILSLPKRLSRYFDQENNP